MEDTTASGNAFKMQDDKQLGLKEHVFRDQKGKAMSGFGNKCDNFKIKTLFN